MGYVLPYILIALDTFVKEASAIGDIHENYVLEEVPPAAALGCWPLDFL